MRKRIKQLSRWRIVRLKASPAAEIGTVEAPNADAAIKEAIRRYGINDPLKQSRLAAYRWS